jgi:hypothetical protein
MTKLIEQRLSSKAYPSSVAKPTLRPQTTEVEAAQASTREGDNAHTFPLVTV